MKNSVKGYETTLKSVFSITMVLAFQPSAFATNCNSLDSLDWLIGDWHSATARLITSESWRRTSDRTFEGKGFTRSIKKNKIVSKESLRLVEMSGEVFYIAKVASNTLPVPFKLTDCSTNIAIFENSSHDFPKKLAYRFIDQNNISVAVSGEQGKSFKILFRRQIN